MKSIKLNVVLFFIVGSLAFSQFGQSGKFEYEIYSGGGNSSFVAADTSGLTSDEVDFIEETAVTGTVSSSEQAGKFEYEVYGKGGNSSFVAADTSGLTSDEIEFIEETAATGTVSSNEQSGLFEYETTGLGGNSSLVGVDPSGFNKEDSKRYLEASKDTFPRESTDNLEPTENIGLELAKGDFSQ